MMHGRFLTAAIAGCALLLAPVASIARGQGPAPSQSQGAGGQGNAQGDPQRDVNHVPPGLIVAGALAAGLAIALAASHGSNRRPVSNQ
jgi:hypothetical protein